jgi:hypothetical protein
MNSGAGSEIAKHVYYRTLHIVNGDVFGKRLEEIDLSGIILPWRENLMEGRVPTLKLSSSGEYDFQSFNSVRSLELAATESLDAASIWSVLMDQISIVANSTAREVVVWIECDLFDLLLLSQIVDIIQRIHRIPKFRVSLVHSSSNLMRHSDEVLAKMFSERKTISVETTSHLLSFWNAFTGTDFQDLRLWEEKTRLSDSDIVQQFGRMIQSLIFEKNTLNLLGLEAFVYQTFEQLEFQPVSTSTFLAELQRIHGDRHFLTDNALKRALFGLVSKGKITSNPITDMDLKLRQFETENNFASLEYNQYFGNHRLDLVAQ